MIIQGTEGLVLIVGWPAACFVLRFAVTLPDMPRPSSRVAHTKATQIPARRFIVERNGTDGPKECVFTVFNLLGRLMMTVSTEFGHLIMTYLRIRLQSVRRPTGIAVSRLSRRPSSITSLPIGAFPAPMSADGMLKYWRLLRTTGPMGCCVILGSSVPNNIYEDVNELPGLSYDFVVVGGGGAGNVVANRLTENPDFSVLVLEAGVSNENVTDSIVPFLVNGLLVPGIYEWNYTSISQPGLNGRSIGIPRAHMLGGCTSHNGMIYTRGSADDYNRFAEVTGDPGWSWDRLLPYFFKNEKWTPPVDHHDTRGQFDPRVHSTTGITAVSLSGYPWTTFSNHVLAATAQQPEDWHFNLDTNSGKPLGTSWVQTTIKGGVRSSSATSYLGPEFIRRPNLHVLLHAQVSKLVNPGHVNGKLHFGGVQFSQGGNLFTAKAAKEIVLSAGAVGTPTILMHSGVGDEALLTPLGIPTLLHLPSVGRNATDQPAFGLDWSVNSTETADAILQNMTLFNEDFAQWNRSHTGPFSVIPTTHLAWLRVADAEFRLRDFTDPSAGKDSPHIEVVFTAGGEIATGKGMLTGLIVLNPVSRGSVTINSTDPFEAPVIDLGFLSHDVDIFVAREAVKKLYKLTKAPAWENYIIAPTQDLESLSQDELDQYIRNNAGTAFHLVGTAAMSARDAQYGVVDPDLLVKGASGLRIIDASIMPFVTSAHTQAAAYVIAERGADLVKSAWK